MYRRRLNPLARLPLAAMLSLSPLAAAQAYVAVAGPSSVSAINRANPSASKTLIAGQGAVAVAVTPDGKRAYVANELGLSVSVIDTSSGRPLAEILLTASPYALIPSPDGSRIYALTQDSYGAAAVLAIDTSANSVLFSHAIPGSSGGWVSSPHMPAPAISADGRTLYIATSSLTIFDLPSQTVTATIQTPSGYFGLTGLAVTPDGSQATNPKPLCPGLFINLVPVHAVARPIQNLGESRSVKQAILAQPFTFLRRAQDSCIREVRQPRLNRCHAS